MATGVHCKKCDSWLASSDAVRLHYLDGCPQPAAQEAEREWADIHAEWAEDSVIHDFACIHTCKDARERGRAEERAEWEKETQEDARIGQEMLDERAVKIDALEDKLAAAEKRIAELEAEK